MSMVQRQLSPLVTRPPPMVPATKPSESSAPLTPMALVRFGPSAKAVVMRASAVGPIMAAATPCPALAPTSTPGTGARAASSENPVNAVTPIPNSLRRPTTSDTRPNSGINAAVGSRQAVTTHCRSPRVAKPSSRPSSGSATVMIE
jgi:hypothetical protein